MHPRFSKARLLGGRFAFGASAVGAGGLAGLALHGSRGARWSGAPQGNSGGPWEQDAVADAFASAWGVPPSQRGAAGVPPPGPPQPPPVVYRSRPRGGRETVGAILAANVGVYLGWLTPPGSPAYSFMHRWFLTSAASLRRGAKGWAEMLLSTYSHSGLMHLGFNMMALWSFAPRLIDGRNTPEAPALSPLSFMAMYTAAGLAGSYSSNLFSAALRHSIPGLGASGSLFGVITYYTLCNPGHGVSIMFVLHMTAQTALIAMTGVNLGLCINSWMRVKAGGLPSSIDGMAHLGGTAVGAAWYAYKRASFKTEAQRGW